MKRFTLTVCVSVLFGAMVQPALAGGLELPVKAPVGGVVVPYSWSGFYMGINFGYNWGDANLSSTAGSQNINANGGLAGYTIGYNWQTGNWLWGLEGDIDGSWLKDTTVSAPLCAGGVGCEIKQTWLATTRGRIGWVINPRWLYYITGGGAYGDAKFTAPSGAGASGSRSGWTVGTGFEWALVNGWSTKIEYLYVDLGTKTCGTGSCALSTDVGFTENILRFGWNYRF